MKQIHFVKMEKYKKDDKREVKVTKYNNGDIVVKGTYIKNTNLQRYKRLNKEEYMDVATGEIKKYKTKNRTLVRAMKRLKELLRNNFTGGNKELFITLTFEKVMKEYENACNEAKNFFRRLKRIYKDIEYVYVLEQQKNLNWHIHTWLKSTSTSIKKLYISNDEINKIWGCGYTKTERVKETTLDVGKLVAYMASTQTKENIPPHKKAYYQSEGIKKAKTEEMKYGEFKNTYGKNANLQHEEAIYVVSNYTDKVINAHFAETWKEHKNDESKK